MTEKDQKSSASRLPRTVWLVGWVSFFADVSSEMMYPLLPLFVVSVLGASKAELGWIEGLAAAVVALMTAYSGWRSDRTGQRVPWIRAGYGLPVLGKALVAVATVWPMVLAGRLLDRLGKGMRGSARDALLADAVESEQRGRAFGLHRAMDTAGAFVGVVLSGAILWWFGGAAGAPGPSAPVGSERVYRLAFSVAAALGLISLAFTFLLRENPRPAHDRPAPEHPAEVGDARRARFGRPYWASLCVLVVFALANSSDAFLLLRAREMGMSPWVVVVLYALYNLTYSLFSYPAGAISDRLGRWPVIALGWAVYAGVYVGFAFSPAGGLWALMALYGVSVALTDGVGKALIADLAPRERKGAALGVFYMCTGFAAMAGSVLTGVLWDTLGARVAFGACAGAAGVAIALVPLAARARSVRGA